MNTIMNKHIYQYIFTFFVILILTSCMGARMNKKAENIDYKNNIVSHQDSNLIVELQYILVKNGRFSWAKDANWDEYIFNIKNISNSDIQINSILVTDSLGEIIKPEFSRKTLIKASKKVIKRYKKQKIKIQLGAGSTDILFKRVGATVVGASAAGFVAGAGAASAVSGTAVAAGAALVIVPALAIGGIVKIMNNSKIDKNIKKRQINFPISILANDETNYNVFYPGIPSPLLIAVDYENELGNKKLLINTQEALNGLHIK